MKQGTEERGGRCPQHRETLRINDVRTWKRRLQSIEGSSGCSGVPLVIALIARSEAASGPMTAMKLVLGGREREEYRCL